MANLTATFAFAALAILGLLIARRQHVTGAEGANRERTRLGNARRGERSDEGRADGDGDGLPENSIRHGTDLLG